MTKRPCEDTISFQPRRKVHTCNSLESYMCVKEEQLLRYDSFLSTPISFSKKAQDHMDPIDTDHIQNAHVYKLWENLCVIALSFPIWNHRHQVDDYHILVDELCDLITFEVKAASFAWTARWEEWQEWDRFLVYNMKRSSLLFRLYQRECLQLLEIVDIHLFDRKVDILLDFFPPMDIPFSKRQCLSYFPLPVYTDSLPNFFILTTTERQ